MFLQKDISCVLLPYDMIYLYCLVVDNTNRKWTGVDVTDVMFFSILSLCGTYAILFVKCV